MQSYREQSETREEINWARGFLTAPVCHAASQLAVLRPKLQLMAHAAVCKSREDSDTFWHTTSNYQCGLKILSDTFPWPRWEGA